MDFNSQVQMENKESKLYFSWTHKMDQVLAASFIDQMNLGNRLDGKFAWKPIAWTSAIEALKKVGVDVSKKNIQSRLRTWEKHYEIVSKMLGESGFSWDHVRGRVIVEDKVWNDYVKSHPKAIPYRSKISIDNWDDICAIFALDGEGDQTELEAEMEMEMEVNRDSNNSEDYVATNQQGKSHASSSSAPLTRKRKQSEIGQVQTGKKKGKGYFSWTCEMDQVLLASFIDQINLGNRLDGKFAWKPIAWTSAIDALKKIGVDISKMNIQSRLRTWEKHYEVVTKMLGETGFSWDRERGRVIVEDNIWNDYVKAHPKAIPYRSKISINNWDDICRIFAQDGEDAQIELEVEMEVEVNRDSNNLEDDATHALIAPNQQEKSNESTSSASHTRKRKKKRKKRGIRQSLDRMADIFDSFPNQQEKSNASTSSASHTRKRKKRGIRQSLDRMADIFASFLKSEPPRATTQMVLDEVYKVKDLNETQILRVVDLLMNDQRKFDTFSGLPNELKRRWLVMHLGNQFK